MQHPWWRPAWTLAEKVLINGACLALLVLAAVYGSFLISLASHAITSKFVLGVLVTLEYAVIVGDAAFILMGVVEHVWRALKRVMQ